MKCILIAIIICSCTLPSSAQYVYDTVQIFYNINIAQPNKQQQASWEQQWKQIAFKNDYTLLLFGYADYLGTEKANYQLAQNRVDNLALWLHQNGVPPENILLKSAVGAVPYDGKPTHEGNQQDRRVDVFVRKQLSKNNTQTQEKVEVIKTTNAPLKVADAFEKVEENQTFELDNLLFKPGMHRLMPESEYVLAELVQVLKDNPAEISIEGHICCLNSGEREGIDIETMQINLSFARAKMVYDYLVSNGIPAKNLSYKGFGITRRKINPELSEYDAQQNRRVEIRVIKRL